MNSINRVLFLAILGFGAAIATGDSEREFVTIADSSERFVGVILKGIENERKPEITIFEVIEADRRLRRLHHTHLVNPIMPLNIVLSSDGRFLVSLDDVWYAGRGPHALVIYDLVRHETISYSCEDFLPKEIQKTLKPHFLPGFHWRTHEGAFNSISTKYFATTPENCIHDGVPFVVIDLLAKKATIQKTPEALPEGTAIAKRVEFKGVNYKASNTWTPSRATVEYKSSALPKTLLRAWPSDKPNEAFELDGAKCEYRRVSNDKWTDPDPWEKVKSAKQSE